jgi:putative FmdB family regulatory protein
MSYHLAVFGLAVVGGECQDRAEGGSVPTYQYTCTECGEPLEAVQKFSDDPLTVCPACGGRLRKVFSAVGIVFKGSGFYRNDSRKAEVSAGAAAKANGSESASGDSGPGSSPGESSSGKSGESSGKSGKSGESSGKSGDSSSGKSSESSGKSGESSGKSGESSGKSSAGEKSGSASSSSSSSSGTKVA